MTTPITMPMITAKVEPATTPSNRAVGKGLQENALKSNQFDIQW